MTEILVVEDDVTLNEVMGFELGANDYVTKPFSLAVLRARINNLLRLSPVEDKRIAYADEHLILDTVNMIYKRDGICG